MPWAVVTCVMSAGTDAVMLIKESVSRICKIKQDLQDLQDLLGVWFIIVSRRSAEMDVVHFLVFDGK